MLFYLLSADELRDTLEWLGYRLDKAAVRRTVDFYLSRTSHGSTLSRPVLFLVVSPCRPNTVLVVFQPAARRRPRRPPTRHDPRGDPSRRHGRHGRPAAALLHRLGNAGRAALAPPDTSA
jgi:hypothetical protein